MKIYIAIWQDRHTDTTAHPFSNPNKAIEWARQQAHDYCRFPEDYAEHDYGKGKDWIFFAEYSCEGDCIYVVETKLDEEIEEIKEEKDKVEKKQIYRIINKDNSFHDYKFSWG